MLEGAQSMMNITSQENMGGGEVTPNPAVQYGNWAYSNLGTC